MKRKHNFNAGPSVLPLKVLEQAQRDLIDFKDSGVGILEMSHRTPLFEKLLHEIMEMVRKLLHVPSDYSIALCTGGATNQFSMVPLNILGKREGNYLLTGIWAEKAFEEGKKFGQVHCVASSKGDKWSFIPKQLKLSTDPAYLHFTSNNTIVGTQSHQEPEAGDIPLVCDASSDIFSREIAIKKYGILYAGAQKNIGTAGVTLVIIRNDLLDRIPSGLPVLMDYRTYIKNDSLYNTPPIFPYYIMHSMLTWMTEHGGVSYFQTRGREFARRLYNVIDSRPEVFTPCAKKEDRSNTNITFFAKSPEAEAKLLAEAANQDIYGIRGHKIVGGIRISLYNAITDEAVSAVESLLCRFTPP